MIDMPMLKSRIEEGIRKIPAYKELFLSNEQLIAIERIFLEALSSNILDLSKMLKRANQLIERELFLNKVPQATLDIIKPHYLNEFNYLFPLYWEPEEEEKVTEQDLKDFFCKSLFAQLNKLLMQHEFEKDEFLTSYKDVRLKAKSVKFLIGNEEKEKEDEVKSVPKHKLNIIK